MSSKKSEKNLFFSKFRSFHLFWAIKSLDFGRSCGSFAPIATSLGNVPTRLLNAASAKPFVKTNKQRKAKRLRSPKSKTKEQEPETIVRNSKPLNFTIPLWVFRSALFVFLTFCANFAILAC